MSGTRLAALALYRNLLQYARQLKLTDQDWAVRRVRQEFERNRYVRGRVAKEAIESGTRVLQQRRLL